MLSAVARLGIAAGLSAEVVPAICLRDWETAVALIEVEEVDALHILRCRNAAYRARYAQSVRLFNDYHTLSAWRAFCSSADWVEVLIELSAKPHAHDAT